MGNFAVVIYLLLFRFRLSVLNQWTLSVSLCNSPTKKAEIKISIFLSLFNIIYIAFLFFFISRLLHFRFEKLCVPNKFYLVGTKLTVKRSEMKGQQ